MCDIEKSFGDKDGVSQDCRKWVPLVPPALPLEQSFYPNKMTKLALIEILAFRTQKDAMVFQARQ